jgi:hypothetical protein
MPPRAGYLCVRHHTHHLGSPGTMKTPRIACALLLTALSSFAQSETPPNHPLVGKWGWTRSVNNCTELYDFRLDGTVPVVSGTERTDNEYSVSPLPDRQGFYRLTMRITKHFGGRDCSDTGNLPDDKPFTNYVKFSPDYEQHIVCYEPSPQQCFGPLRRIKQ